MHAGYDVRTTGAEERLIHLLQYAVLLVDITTVIKRRLVREYSCATRELVFTQSLRYALAGNAGRFRAAGRAHCSRRSSITV